MARPIEIPIVSDVAGFLKGTTDVEQALDDVASSLDDLSREAQGAGQEAGRELADGIRDGAEDAEKALDNVAKSDALDRVGENAEDAAREVESAADRMEKSFRDAFDTVKKESRTAGRDVGDNTKQGFDKASEGAEEFKDEANSTAREAAASFDGSAASITDAFQEVAANAFAGFGPAGAAAGLAAAAGIGLVVSAFDKGKERAQELRDRIGEIRDGFLAVRVDGDSALRVVSDRMRDIVTETDESKTNIDAMADAAKGLSEIDFETFARGLAGDPAALEEAIRLEKERLEQIDAATGFAGAYERAQGLFHETERDRANERLEMLEAEQKAQSSADSERQRQAEREIARIEEEAAAREEKTEAAIRYLDEEAAAADRFASDYADSIQGAYDEAGQAIDQFVEDGKFNLDAYNKHMEENAESIRKYQQNIVAAAAFLSQEALDYVRSLGPAAAPALQAFIDAPNDQKGRTAANWHAQGVVASDAFEDSLKAGIPDTVDGPRVIVKADTRSADQSIRDLDGQVIWLNVRSRFVNQPV